MVGFGDRDGRGTVQQPLDRDSGFGSGQRRAGTAVDATPERQMLAGVLARRVEGVRIVEAARIAVGRAVEAP